MRNIYKTEEYFEHQIDEVQGSYDRSIVKLANPDITEQAKQNRLSILAEVDLDRSLILYNIGKPLDHVIEHMRSGLHKMMDMFDYASTTDLPFHQKRILTNTRRFNLFPLLVLCDARKELCHRYIEMSLRKDMSVEYDHETDEADYAPEPIRISPLINEFAKYFGYDVPPENVAPRCYLESFEAPIYECFTCHEGRHQEILTNYVTNWAKTGQKDEKFYIKSEHENPKNKYFTGYWCFMGAAVAKVLNIDDSPLRDHPDYPYELVHYKEYC
ncbi:PoNe immunity protein domain-containing protein [Pseudovibrio brasiliensis]|uniref:DUF1911 domain-containing protein n=1 Tax=Pseudovibrio brasiliensis TaxID=1898042 RepID=A0ABX8ATW8_9HYPH|nr:PoNe immunity protein domain-containing protein [Pseudovibrio brasiliensis]QUS57141.1 DUF1911 domain-containing protein [Pseudovibrio brasiliensis]